MARAESKIASIRPKKMNLAVQVRKTLSEGFTLDVDLRVAPGITIVFGASGAGKTTLLRAVAGLLRPDRGRIAVGERVLFDSSRAINVDAAERNIGYVFQSLALFPHLTVEQNVHYGLAALGEAEKRERTRNILESFRIAALLERKPGQISGGERQRVALARALVTDPCALLLDEPLTALDYPAQSAIIEDLRAWNAARGIAILYVTHAHREVYALGERVVALDRGRILAQGTPQQVLDSPTNEAVAQLAGFENLFDARVVSLDAASGTMHCALEAGAIELEVPLARVDAGAHIHIAIRAGDILLSSEEPHGLSARNIFPGKIAALEQQGALVITGVNCGIGAGCQFQVHLTPSARKSLQLEIGTRVWLVIKTYSCHFVSPVPR